MNQFSPQQIALLCQRALLYEASATPKPGLVDRQNSGAHTDMDFYTFLDSAITLGPYFQQVAQTAWSWRELPDNGLALLRPLGIRAEEQMLSATGGVNTHKGLVFSLGLLSAAAAFLAGAGRQVTPQEVCRVGAVLAAGAQADFLALSDPHTAGERLYLAHRITGVRGEAASGFASVRCWGLPALKEALGRGASFNDACLQALLALMAQVTDTNVIHRRGLEALEWVQKEASALLEAGGILAPCGVEKMRELDRILIRENISPGGCADLLAAAIFLFFLEEKQKGDRLWIHN